MNKLILETGAELPIAERVAITRQANDLSSITTVESDYSTEFTLPDTVEVRALLGQAQAGTSTSDVPYTDLPSTLVTAGIEAIPRALTRLEEHEEGRGYRLRCFGGNRRLFAALGDLTLRDLNLSDLDHEYFTGIMVNYTNSTDWQTGVIYDLYDRGKGDPSVLMSINTKQYAIWPSFFARYLWQKIMDEAGFRWSGDIPASFDRLLLPSVEAFGYSEETRAEHKAKVGLRWNQHVRKGGEWGPDVIPYARHIAPFYQGPAVVFDNSTNEYVVMIAGYFKARAGIYVALSNDFGTTGFRMDLDVNGTSQIYTLLTTTNQRGPEMMTVSHDRLLLQVGDRIRARIRGEHVQGVIVNARWFYPMFPGQFWPNEGPIVPQLPDNWPQLDENFFEIELLQEFPVGGLVRAVDWIPDMTQKAFIKTIISLYGLTQQANPYADELFFHRTAPVLTTAPLDWTSRLDTARAPKRSWQIGDFTQHNWFRWLEDDANPPEAKYLGDGEIPSPAGSVELKDVLTMPFAASPVGKGGLLLIPNWVPRPNTSPVEYDSQTPKPRLVLLNPDDRRPVILVDEAGGVPATMTTSTFVAPVGEDLDFARTLLPLYWPHLAAVLRRPFVITCYVRLTPPEAATLDQLQPVWLEREGHSFFVNRLSQYEADAPSAEVQLLRMTPP